MWTVVLVNSLLIWGPVFTGAKYSGRNGSGLFDRLDEKLTWYEAYSECQGRRASLSILRDTTIRDLDLWLPKDGSRIWVGGRYVYTTWSWLDGCGVLRGEGCTEVKQILKDTVRGGFLRAEDPFQCLAACDTSFVAVQGTTCYCLLSKPASSVDASFCRLRCAANFDHACGGLHGYASVYASQPDRIPWDPDVSQLQGDCAYLHLPRTSSASPQDVRMRADACNPALSGQYRQFLCEICPRDSDKCHVKRHIQYMTWTHANQACQSEGGQLLTTRKNESLPLALLPYNQEEYWIGLSRDFVLRWIDASAVQSEENQGSSGNVPVKMEGGFCMAAEMGDNGDVRLVAIDCTSKLPFACDSARDGDIGLIQQHRPDQRLRCKSPWLSPPTRHPQPGTTSNTSGLYAPSSSLLLQRTSDHVVTSPSSMTSPHLISSQNPLSQTFTTSESLTMSSHTSSLSTRNPSKGLITVPSVSSERILASVESASQFSLASITSSSSTVSSTNFTPSEVSLSLSTGHTPPAPTSPAPPVPQSSSFLSTMREYRQSPDSVFVTSKPTSIPTSYASFINTVLPSHSTLWSDSVTDVPDQRHHSSTASTDNIATKKVLAETTTLLQQPRTDLQRISSSTHSTDAKFTTTTNTSVSNITGTSPRDSMIRQAHTTSGGDLDYTLIDFNSPNPVTRGPEYPKTDTLPSKNSTTNPATKNHVHGNDTPSEYTRATTTTYFRNSLTSLVNGFHSQSARNGPASTHSPPKQDLTTFISEDRTQPAQSTTPKSKLPFRLTSMFPDFLNSPDNTTTQVPIVAPSAGLTSPQRKPYNSATVPGGNSSLIPTHRPTISVRNHNLSGQHGKDTNLPETFTPTATTKTSDLTINTNPLYELNNTTGIGPTVHQSPGSSRTTTMGALLKNLSTRKNPTRYSSTIWYTVTKHSGTGRVTENILKRSLPTMSHVDSLKKTSFRTVVTMSMTSAHASVVTSGPVSGHMTSLSSTTSDPREHDDKRTPDDLTPLYIVIGILAGLFLIIVVVVIGVFKFRYRRRRRFAELKNYDDGSLDGSRGRGDSFGANTFRARSAMSKLRSENSIEVDPQFRFVEQNE